MLEFEKEGWAGGGDEMVEENLGPSEAGVEEEKLEIKKKTTEIWGPRNGGLLLWFSAFIRRFVRPMAPFTTISSFLLQLAETVVGKIKKLRRVCNYSGNQNLSWLKKKNSWNCTWSVIPSIRYSTDSERSCEAS